MLRTSTSSVSKLSRPSSSAVANCSSLLLRSTGRRPRSSSPPPLSSFLPLPSEIHVVPFSISPETALKRSDGYGPSAFDKSSPKWAWLAHRLLPSFFPNRFSVVNQKMVYLPVWSVKAKATSTVTVTGEDSLSARELFEGSASGGKAEKEERRRRQEEEEERFKISGKRTFKLGFETELAFFPGEFSVFYRANSKAEFLSFSWQAPPPTPSLPSRSNRPFANSQKLSPSSVQLVTSTSSAKRSLSSPSTALPSSSPTSSATRSGSFSPTVLQGTRGKLETNSS